MLDSSILDFWAASGLIPETDGAHKEEGVTTWPSCDSLIGSPAGSCPSKTTSTSDLCEAYQASTRQLRRKRALMQLHLASPVSPVGPTAPLTENIFSFHSSSAEPGPKVLHMSPSSDQTHNQNMTTLLTLSGEKVFRCSEW